MEFQLSELLQVVNPEHIIRVGGIILILLIVFAETGLFFGFFLPGDTLLFTAGLLSATGVLATPVVPLLLLVIVAAIIGDATGYWFGRKVGNRLYLKKENIFFKKKYLSLTESYYNKYGGMTLVIGRFLPVVRTFAPIIAGTVKMNYKKFTMFNISGGIVWSTFFILAGYFLGIKFPSIIEHMEYFIIGFGVLTFGPLISFAIKNRKRKLVAAE